MTITKEEAEAAIRALASYGVINGGVHGLSQVALTLARVGAKVMFAGEEEIAAAIRSAMDPTRNAVRLPVLNPHTWDTPMDEVGVDINDIARAVLASLREA